MYHRHVFLVQGSASVGQVLDIVLELSEQERCAVVRGIAEQCQVSAKVGSGGAGSVNDECLTAERGAGAHWNGSPFPVSCS